ncbi:alpha/beta hydrolase [Aeromicrobium sp.]|uniref:alpha/beta fold hydrolase n=1 Tax=Aeromicrobium sp. TaxID=1871063 RepID=UPI0028ACC1C8|nr:alpha/beta hydrolase [Aeromicrobium sp.]
MLSELAFTRRGQGDPLVLLHGIGHRHAAFEPVLDELARHYDVIAADLPGLGDSPPLPAGVGYSAENVAAAITENFALWGIDKPHVAGNSLGGLLSIALAQRGDVASATGLSPAGFFRPWSLLHATVTLLPLKLGSYLPAPVLKAASKLTLGRFLIGFTLYHRPGRYSPERVYGDALAMKKGAGFWRYFLRCFPLGFTSPESFRGSCLVPITIAWGDKDKILHKSQAKLAAKRMKGVEFVTLKDCGHVPMGDSPEQVIAAIRATTARAEQGASSVA